jgi:hypothetical protein
MIANDARHASDVRSEDYFGCHLVSIINDDAAPQKNVGHFEMEMPYVCDVQIYANSSVEFLHHHFAKMRAR